MRDFREESGLKESGLSRRSGALSNGSAFGAAYPPVVLGWIWGVSSNGGRRHWACAVAAAHLPSPNSACGCQQALQKGEAGCMERWAAAAGALRKRPKTSGRWLPACAATLAPALSACLFLGCPTCCEMALHIEVENGVWACWMSLYRCRGGGLMVPTLEQILAGLGHCLQISPS